MKKRGLIYLLVLFILVIIAFVNLSFFTRFESYIGSTRDKLLNEPYQWPTPAPIHEIQETRSLKIEWQLANVNSSVGPIGPYMTARNGKIAFLGSLRGKDSYGAIVLNASDGKQIAEIGPIGYSTQFTLDDSAIYFGKPDVINKIDYQSGQQIWSQQIGHFNVPSFFRLVDGELQSSWNVRAFFILATKDGQILRKLTNVSTPIFLLENNILYYQSSPGLLAAKTLEGNNIWETDLGNGSISQTPIFSANRIYLRTGGYGGEIFSIDRHSGQVIWHTDKNALSNFALSNNSIYYLTTDGYFLGLNPGSGEREAFVKLSPEEFYRPQVGSISFQVAYDDLTQNILLLLGDSAQLFAYKKAE